MPFNKAKALQHLPLWFSLDFPDDGCREDPCPYPDNPNPTIEMINAKIVGAGGYGGVGLIEFLLRHPEVNIGCLDRKSVV